MASRMFENLNAIVANTLTDSIKMIDIDELHESKDNFFQVDRIEEFADTIMGQGGVKDNLVVRPLESGGYEIISGHRRRAAVQLLLDRGENIARLLPCLVQNYTDEDTKLLDIVLMNVSARQISDMEMWKSYEIVERILKDKKDKGEKFGRVREKLAEILGVSSSQIGKMQNVKNNAIQPVVDAVQNGEISISTANEIAKLDVAEQEKLVQEDISNVKHKEVKQKNEATRADKQENPEKVDTYSTKSESDPEPEKVDTCSTKSEFDPEPEKVDTYSTKSESDPEPEKVDTCSTKSEPDAEPEKVDTCSTKSESDPESEKVDTYSTKSESDPEPEKVDTCSTKSESDKEPEKVDTYSTFSKFIYDKYYDIEEIIEDCMETYYDEKDEEYKTLQEMLTMLHQIKEDFRKKIRLGL